MTTLFVTGAGTDIGKTVVCCRLLEELPPTLSVRCIKPIVTGFDPNDVEPTDTARLLRAQGLPADAERIDATSPWRFCAALSPDMAAAREDRAIAFDDVVAFCRERPGDDLTLIEGIGGVMVPLDETHTVLDLIAALDAQVLLVAGSYLGSLSHTLTALNALKQRRAAIAAIIVSQSATEPVPTAETISSLRRFAGDLPIQLLPRPVPREGTLFVPWLIEDLLG